LLPLAFCCARANLPLLRQPVPGEIYIMNRNFAALCVLGVLALFSRIGHAAADVYTFNYQAKLTSATGDPLEGSHTFYFRIIQGGSAGDPLSGNIIYAETASVAAADGVVNHAIGSGTPTTGTLSSSLFHVGNLYHLQVAVDTESNLILPRTVIQSVPMALRTDYAQRAPWTGLEGIPDDLQDGGSVANVVTVAKSGGQFTSIQSALDSITDASLANPYLVKVAPGVYEEHVQMIPNVDIEGSGELSSIITAEPDFSAVLRGASDCELRQLTVLATGTGLAVAIETFGTSTRFRNVTATASGAEANFAFRILSGGRPDLQNVTATADGTSGGGQATAIFVSSASARIDSVRASVSGNDVNGIRTNSSLNVVIQNSSVDASSTATGVSGIFCEGSSADIVNCSIRASSPGATFGVLSFSNPSLLTFSNVRMDNCVVSAPGHTCYVNGGSSLRVANCRLDGGSVIADGTLICTLCHDENYIPSTYPNCP
jgi:hypothetical protein